MKDIAISVTELSKNYRLYDSTVHRLKEALHPFKKRYYHDFAALQAISFSVRKGECLGVIGRNGSGKSTLLQILCGILQPTKGYVTVQGRISALLELGTGFNPQLTGRDNVFMYGSIMGISREDMASRFQSIAALADIGEFIDQPVKTYSSGMFMRLAFAAAVSIDPDILILDEALAVGDVFFRQKCYQHFEELRAKGATIILVSHAMVDVSQFCDRALLLERGRVHFIGNASEAVKQYYLLEQQKQGGHVSDKCDMMIADDKNVLRNFRSAEGSPVELQTEACFDISNISEISNGWARCTGVALCDERGMPRRIFEQGERACFHFEFSLMQDIEVPIGGVVIKNEKNIILHGKSTLEYGSPVPARVDHKMRIQFSQEIELRVATGEYTFDIGLATMSKEAFDSRSTYQHELLSARTHRICHLTNVGSFSVVLRKNHEGTKLMHHGLCDLPGRCSVLLSEVGHFVEDKTR